MCPAPDAGRGWHHERIKGYTGTTAGIAATVKDKVDLVEVIGETVQLKKAGVSFKGLCPFHGEKTPSFVVTPARETWKCFGCGKGGDVFSFVMERDGVLFPEALRRLAARAGVELDERTTREDAQRKRLRDVMEAAISFYHAALTASPVGQRALDYLRGRGFTDATIQAYQLGYAPDAWDGLTKALITKRNVSEDELEAAGLVVRSTRRPSGGPAVYDRFRSRVIFPIRDASGGASGLGGRILDEAPAADGTPARDRGPKYLNSPATLLFDKSRTLYLIDRAKAPARKAGQVVIVEGYTDALMAHQAGFENVVGGLGTALTAGQVELATRYAPAIALAYDVDPAGQGAGTFGATELSSLIGEIERSPHRGRLTDVGVVRLPEGKDPDEVIREDPAVWREATEHVVDVVDYLLEHYAKRYPPTTQSGKDRLVSAMAPILRSLVDPVRRELYVRNLSVRSGVDDRSINEKLRQPGVAVGPGAPHSGALRARGVDGEAHAGARINLDAVLATPDALDPQSVTRALDPVELTLLRLLLIHPELQPSVGERLAPDALITTPARELWRGMLADRAADAGGGFRRDRFLEALDPTLAALARTLYARSDPDPDGDAALDQAVEQCLLRLEQRRLADLFDFRRAELAEAEADRDTAAASRLRDAVRELDRTRSDLDRRLSESSLLARHRAHPGRTSAGATTLTTPDPQPTAEPQPLATPAGGPAR
ncbi:MAG: DNA primase [Candidatus Limnocylindrales bacterium]